LALSQISSPPAPGASATLGVGKGAALVCSCLISNLSSGVIGCKAVRRLDTSAAALQPVLDISPFGAS